MSDPTTDSLQLFASRYNLDSAIMSSLLSTALSRGGEFAELFFEHRTNSAITWEEQRVKSASRHVAQGVGIRVVKGDAMATPTPNRWTSNRCARPPRRPPASDPPTSAPQPIDATPQMSGVAYYSSEEPLTAAAALRKGGAC